MLAAAVVLLTAASLGVEAPVAPQPIRYVEAADIEVPAAAWVVYDETTDVELAAAAASERRPMASTTKLMTALVILEEAELLDPVRVTAGAAATGQKEIGLVAGETWTVDLLLGAMLIHSANDAAVALADHVGRRQFVAMMNDKAAELGLVDTRYANAHGLDARNHYSTARDLLVLGRAALAEPRIAQLARLETARLPSFGGGTPRVADATNLLLGSYPGAAGLKTGRTRGAGEVLVAVAERGSRTVWAVVMGSSDAHRDAAQLLEAGFRTTGARAAFERTLETR